VVDPVVACITTIELEHTHQLGDTEAAIAGEKAGIIKPGRPVVLGSLGSEAAKVIRARAEEVGAEVLARDEHFWVRPTKDGQKANAFAFQASESLGDSLAMEIELCVPGDAAIANAGLAIACVQSLHVHSGRAIERASRVALSRCVLPARIEVLANDPMVIVDAAHTAASAQALAYALETLAPDGFELILSVSSDKNLGALLEALLPATRRVWVTEADPIRSMSVDVLAKGVRERAPELPIEVVEDPEQAARCARATLPSDSRLCAAGSIYLAGIVRRVLGAAAASA
jgi:dihydrofolate synthase/folylpolyglutamate synthase